MQALAEENRQLKNELMRLRGNTLERESVRRSPENVNPSTEEKSANKDVRIYHVKAGDTLSKIAKKFYNDATLWDLIYQANRDALQSPSGIRVGQTLVIPLVP